VAANVMAKKDDKNVASRLVAFGSEEFVDNKSIGKGFNRDLALNAINWTVGEDKQISIRPRAVRASRATISAESMQLIFYTSVLVLPELLLLAGIAVWSRRRTL